MKFLIAERGGMKPDRFHDCMKVANVVGIFQYASTAPASTKWGLLGNVMNMASKKCTS